jgi:hypothetical protein
MEDVYIPKHLLMPFFHGRPILYRIAPNLEYTEGELDLTVFGGGLCHTKFIRSEMASGISGPLFQLNRMGMTT